MKKIILTFLLVSSNFLLTFAQSQNTTQFYAAAIDTTLTLLKVEPLNQPVLVRIDRWYKKNIETYRGEFLLKPIGGLKNDNLGSKKEFVLLDIYPLTVANNEILVMITAKTITYKSKNRWKLKPLGNDSYYTIFRFNSDQNSYNITEVIEGAYCPNTTDWINYNKNASGL